MDKIKADNSLCIILPAVSLHCNPTTTDNFAHNQVVLFEVDQVKMTNLWYCLRLLYCNWFICFLSSLISLDALLPQLSYHFKPNFISTSGAKLNVPIYSDLTSPQSVPGSLRLVFHPQIELVVQVYGISLSQAAICKAQTVLNSHTKAELYCISRLLICGLCF